MISTQAMLVCIVCLTTQESLGIPSHQTVITLTDGKQVTGLDVHLATPNLPRVRAYLGIRYASIGLNRWPGDKLEESLQSVMSKGNETRLPVVAQHRFGHSVASFFYESPDGVESKVTLPPVCPQAPSVNLKTVRNVLSSTAWQKLETILSKMKNQSEECLSLNIYVPLMSSVTPSTEHIRRLPVVIFVHGDSYEFGSGNVYDLSIFAGITQTIGVTLNFRLGMLGFLSLKDGQSNGNYALFDLHAAVLWVQTNIASFGGDPEQITLMGYGYGAALVHLFSLSKLSEAFAGKGIKRLILINGSGLSPWATSDCPSTVADNLARHLNITIEMKLQADLKASSSSKKGENKTSTKVNASQTGLPDYTGKSGNVMKLSANDTVKNKTPIIHLTLDQRLANLLKRLPVEMIIRAQNTISTESCLTKFGPTITEHLFSDLLKTFESLTENFRANSGMKPESLHPLKTEKPRLFFTADVIVGVFQPSPTPSARRHAWTDKTVLGLEKALRFIYPSMHRAISDVLVHIYTKGHSTTYKTANQTHRRRRKRRNAWLPIDNISSMLVDGLFTTALLQTAELHHRFALPLRSTLGRRARVYLLVFHEQPVNPSAPTGFDSSGYFVNLSTSVFKMMQSGDLAYYLGAPLVTPNTLTPFPATYSENDARLSSGLLRYIANFIRNGDPNHSTGSQHSKMSVPHWPAYETHLETYLKVGTSDEPTGRLATKNNRRSGENDVFGGNSNYQVGHYYKWQQISAWSELLPRLAGLPNHYRVTPRRQADNDLEKQMPPPSNLSTANPKLPELTVHLEKWSPEMNSAKSLLYFLYLRHQQMCKTNAGDTDGTKSSVPTRQLLDPRSSGQSQKIAKWINTDRKRGMDSHRSSLSPPIKVNANHARLPGFLHSTPSKHQWWSKRENTSSEEQPASSDVMAHSIHLWTILAGSTLFLLNGIVFIGMYHQAHRLRKSAAVKRPPEKSPDVTIGEVQRDREGMGTSTMPLLATTNSNNLETNQIQLPRELNDLVRPTGIRMQMGYHEAMPAYRPVRVTGGNCHSAGVQHQFTYNVPVPTATYPQAVVNPPDRADEYTNSQGDNQFRRFNLL